MYIPIISNLITGIHNFWIFRKEIYTYRWWYPTPMYDLIIKCLKNMEDQHLTKSTATNKHRDGLVRKIRLCRLALQRITNGEYDQTALERICSLYPIKTFPVAWDDSGNPTMYQLVDHGEDSHKMFSEHAQKEKYLKEQDWDLFCKYFRESERFWD